MFSVCCDACGVDVVCVWFVCGWAFGVRGVVWVVHVGVAWVCCEYVWVWCGCVRGVVWCVCCVCGVWVCCEWV